MISALILSAALAGQCANGSCAARQAPALMVPHVQTQTSVHYHAYQEIRPTAAVEFLADTPVFLEPIPMMRPVYRPAGHRFIVKQRVRGFMW